MKALGRVAVIGSLAVVAAVGVTPAQAAPYTIAAGHWGGLSATARVFTQQDCAADFVSSPLNGVDARVLNISASAGKRINLRWAGTVLEGGALNANFYDSACEPKRESTNKASFAPGNYFVTVPAGTKWIVVEPSRSAQISFEVLPA